MRHENSRRNIIHSYNQWADFYDNRYFQIQNMKYKLIFERQIEIGREKIILDVGCGTGNLFLFLERLDCSKYGIDFSHKCLKKWQQKNENNSLVYNVCADIDFLPFRKESFDILFLITILQNVPNPEKSLVELKKLCKPKGLIILSFLKKKFDNTRIAHLLDEVGLKPEEIINVEDCEDYIVIIRNS